MESGMRERKPREITFASWVDQQISEAAERGAFDDLPGAGKPISRRGGTDAWLQDYLRREGVSGDELLPTPLRLRKEVERLAASVQDLRSEQEVREVVKGLNRQIAEWRRFPAGPPVYVRLVDEGAMVDRWRDAHRRPPAPAPPARSHPDPPPRPSRWWRRRRSLVPDAGQRACRTTAFSSSWLSGTGLPCMLLDVAALAAMPSASPGPRPNAASPGTPSRLTVSPTQARPSSTDAPGFPVSSCAASAYRSSTEEPGATERRARTLASMTGASSAAQAMPCGTSAVPPMTPASPCTAPSFALASAMPPSRAHMAMSSRAPRSLPSAWAARRPAAARRSPSRARPSVSGFARTETNGSRHWVSASRPLAAVTGGGHDTVSSGSTSATRGIISGLRRLAFRRCPGTASTALAVTSAPVPAVVGTATQGAASWVIFCPDPTTSR